MTNNQNTIVRIEDRQEMDGESLINTYHYLVNNTDPSPDLEALATSFISSVVTPIATQQASSLTHLELYLKTVNRGSVEHTEPVAIDGSLTAVNPMPSFVACSVRLNRTDTSTRNGWKRIAGQWDEAISGNDYTAAALASFAASYLLPMTQDIVIGANTWQPIIFGEVLDEATGLSRVNFISTGLVKPWPSTQNSRKQTGA